MIRDLIMMKKKNHRHNIVKLFELGQALFEAGNHITMAYLANESNYNCAN